jgi:hypothetical protein
MRAMKTLLALGAASLVLAALFLLYLVSQEPFEFARPACVPGDAAGWWDVVRLGCLDALYVAQFLAAYGAMVFAALLILLGLMRLARRA